MKLSYAKCRRKALHILAGVVIVLGLHFGVLTSMILFVCLCVGVLISFVLSKYSIPWFDRITQLFERRSKYPGHGSLTYLIGVLLTIQVFKADPDIALAAILILAFGDGISPLFGMCFGKTKTPLSDTKLLEGTLVGILCATLAALYFVSWYEALLAATVAMGLEATEIKLNNKILDDNILVPLAAGTTIILLRMYM
jgi:dolichol kinase